MLACSSRQGGGRRESYSNRVFGRCVESLGRQAWRQYWHSFKLVNWLDFSSAPISQWYERRRNLTDTCGYVGSSYVMEGQRKGKAGFFPQSSGEDDVVYGSWDGGESWGGQAIALTVPRADCLFRVKLPSFLEPLLRLCFWEWCFTSVIAASLCTLFYIPACGN